MATSTLDDRDQDKRLTAAEQAEFEQLAASLRDTPAADSDQPYIPVSNATPYDDRVPSGISQPSALTPDAIRKREQRNRVVEEKLGRGYTKTREDDGQKAGQPKRRLRSRLKSALKKRGVMVGISFVASSAIGTLLMISFLPFQLNHIMKNIDAKTFARLQGVATEGRSRAWLQAYMTARLLDIEDPNNAKKHDNVLFRATQVKYNDSFLAWFRTVRKDGMTSKFERDLFENHGIKFSSLYKQEGNKVVIRVAKITVLDTELSFDPFSGPDAISPDLLDRLVEGDVTAFEELDRLNGKLDEFIRVEFFDNKTGREKVIETMEQLFNVSRSRWLNAFYRYHVRKDIQNMTGITSWKFFETKRQKVGESFVGWRNKVITKIAQKALPANSARALQCAIGAIVCRASTDPSSPDNKNLPVSGQRNDGKVDPDGNPIGGNGEQQLGEALKPSGDMSSSAVKIANAIGSGAGRATNIVSIIDALARFDRAMYDHTLSRLITMARSQQLAALYATYGIASDQLHTGEVGSGEEVNALMETVADSTNNEGWSTLVDERPNVAAAQEFVPAATKEQYCSAEHQEAIRKYRYTKPVKNEFVHNCNPVGAANFFTTFEASYMRNIGFLLHPIAVAWLSTGGYLVDVFNGIVSFISGPVMEAAIAAAGLGDDIAEVVAWAGVKVAEFSGAAYMWDELTLPGEMMNLIIQGGIVTAEASARGQGAALTTPETRQLTEERVQVYLRQQRANSSLYDRYASLDKPDSVASNALFALVNRPSSNVGQDLLSSMGSIFTAPFGLISKTVSAQTAPSSAYIGAERLAMIETYDLPIAECVDAKPLYMTPPSATNADEMGIFDPDELSWDLMNDKDRWYAELYNRVGNDDEKAKQVWNCALLDNAVSGAMGGIYGYKGVGALSSQP